MSKIDKELVDTLKEHEDEFQVMKPIRKVDKGEIITYVGNDGDELIFKDFDGNSYFITPEEFEEALSNNGLVRS